VINNYESELLNFGFIGIFLSTEFLSLFTQFLL